LDKSLSYHLGLSDEAQEGDWLYVDGRKVNTGTVGFNRGEPNGKRRENFGSLWRGSYTINDIPNLENPFICEFKVQPKYRYTAFSNKLRWKEARGFCQNKGGDLANHGIETTQLRSTKFAGLNLDKSLSYHLGLSDEAQEGDWLYVDGRKVNKGTVGFNSGEPNGKRRENFGSLWHGSSTINDIPNLENPFICEFIKGYF